MRLYFYVLEFSYIIGYNLNNFIKFLIINLRVYVSAYRELLNYGPKLPKR